MMRKEREIQDREGIIDVLKKCDTLSIGFQGEQYPYVVPVSFGVVQKEDALFVYFHGAKQGHKVEQIEKNPKVCLEGHVFHEVQPTEYGITTRYESVIGFGTVEKVEGKEVVEGLKSITAHYGYPEYPIGRCRGLPATAVYKIRLERITGKRNVTENFFKEWD